MDIKLKQALMLYRDILKNYCIVSDGTEPPKKLPDVDFGRMKVDIPWITAVQHVAWMCDKAWDLAEEGHTEKAMRWLGFIQGVMWCLNMRTINQMRDDSRQEETDE